MTPTPEEQMRAEDPDIADDPTDLETNRRALRSIWRRLRRRFTRWWIGVQ
ncbi:hypothetical protein [Gordonia soli]|nr:hypothetical protein [Gordonia soli]